MAQSGAQTLYRGLMTIEAVVNVHCTLKDISLTLGISRSTTHRLLQVLVEQKYLRQFSSEYALGPKLVEYGMRSLSKYPLRDAAAPYLQELSRMTHDTVHLGIREDMEVFYIEKISGSRAVDMNSRVGYRMPLDITGIGKALLLDSSNQELKEIHQFYNRQDDELPDFISKMDSYRKNSYALDLTENEINIRCVAAPVRNGENKIVAAISVASMFNYMTDERMQELIPVVKQVARNISLELGWFESKIA